MPTIRAQASRRVKCEKAGPDHRGTPLNAQLATLFWPSLMPHRSSPLQNYEMMKSSGFSRLCKFAQTRSALWGTPSVAFRAARSAPTRTTSERHGGRCIQEPHDLGTPRRALHTEPPDGSALVQVGVDASSDRRKPRASNNLDGPGGALDSCFSQANRPLNPEPRTPNPENPTPCPSEKRRSHLPSGRRRTNGRPASAIAESTNNTSLDATVAEPEIPRLVRVAVTGLDVFHSPARVIATTGTKFG